MAKIEFYNGDASKALDILDDGAVPRQGEFVNIRGETWFVERVTWAVDSNQPMKSTLRANVELSPVKRSS